jgi:hypothetical protein
VYPVAAVAEAVAERFVALRLDQKEPHVRDLKIHWIPTVLILDRRGVEHYRSVNAVPPAEFLDVLDIGEALARMREAGYDRAVSLLEAGLGRRPNGPLHPELLFWLGVARCYRGGHDGAARDAAWADLTARYPASIWALRVPPALDAAR